MGFFKKLGNALNPVNHLKDPKKALTSGASMFLDPAGSIIRGGKTGDVAPHKFKETYDPARFLEAPPDPAAPAPYTPKREFQLSPRAQALYDRMNQRNPIAGSAPAAQPQQPQGMAGRIAQQVIGQRQTALPQQAPVQQPQPTTGVAPPQRVLMADGGEVQGKQRVKLDVDAHFESKVFEFKPNGKPC